MNEERILITKEQLIEQNFVINKKFVVIDSSLYTPEAFEYIQELVTFAGAILFVADTKKIFARGKYFGGDIFEADLLYFTNIYTVTGDGSGLTGIVSASKAKDSLAFQGINNVITTAKYDEVLKFNKIEIDYDLKNAVNKESFTLNTNAEYNLDVVDGKIKIIEYKPCKVTLSSLHLLEYDSGNTLVTINITKTGSLPLTEFKANVTIMNNGIEESRTDLIEEININEDSCGTIKINIPNNTDTKLTIEYADEKTQGVKLASVTQIWGYACIYGYYDILNKPIPSSSTFDTFEKYIISNDPSKTIILNQQGLEYGVFACPKEFDVIFTDASTNLQGGWKKIGTFTHYIFNTEYQIYGTDQYGLGSVKWIINKK